MEGFNIKCASRISPWSFSFQHLPDDLFFFLKDVGICNFADDATTYIYDESLENTLKLLEKNVITAIRWFENNYMKLNTGKCRLTVSGYKHEQVWANIGTDLI